MGYAINTVVELEGKKYIACMEESYRSCEGCYLYDSDPSDETGNCYKLNYLGAGCDNNNQRIIWKPLVLHGNVSIDQAVAAIKEYDKPIQTSDKKHKHYYKYVGNLEYIDVYSVLKLYEVTDPCIQHALKKLLVAGARGYKDIERDIQDIIDTLERWKELSEENSAKVRK